LGKLLRNGDLEGARKRLEASPSAEAAVVWTDEAEERMATVPGGARGLARPQVRPLTGTTAARGRKIYVVKHAERTATTKTQASPGF